MGADAKRVGGVPLRNGGVAGGNGPSADRGLSGSTTCGLVISVGSRSRHASSHITAEQLALQRGDLGQAVYLSGLFHTAIAEMAHQRTIAAMISGVDTAVDTRSLAAPQWGVFSNEYQYIRQT